VVLLRDRIYSAIRQAILTAEFPPGQELREQILAERYHVSRSPIRDSLLRLEQEDLVTVLPRQGYRVRPISIYDVEEILGLRLVIESACVEEATRSDDAALQALDCFRGFADSDFTESGYVEYNASFHKAISSLSRNRRLAALARDLADQFERLALIGLRSLARETIHQLCAEHEAIIDAVQAHDPDLASRLTREHALGSQTGMVSALRTLARQDGKEAPGTECCHPPLGSAG